MYQKIIFGFLVFSPLNIYGFKIHQEQLKQKFVLKAKISAALIEVVCIKPFHVKIDKIYL